MVMHYHATTKSYLAGSYIDTYLRSLVNERIGDLDRYTFWHASEHDMIRTVKQQYGYASRDIDGDMKRYTTRTIDALAATPATTTATAAAATTLLPSSLLSSSPLDVAQITRDCMGQESSGEPERCLFTIAHERFLCVESLFRPSLLMRSGTGFDPITQRSVNDDDDAWPKLIMRAINKCDATTAM